MRRTRSLDGLQHHVADDSAFLIGYWLEVWDNNTRVHGMWLLVGQWCSHAHPWPDDHDYLSRGWVDAEVYQLDSHMSVMHLTKYSAFNKKLKEFIEIN